MARTISQIRASLASLYDPQADLLRRQQATIPGEEQATVAGLEQAKTNAFGDIDNAANARGMAYSGAPIAEQQRFVGEKFLPALAGVRSDYAGRRSKLEAGLLDLEAGRSREAQDIYSGELKAEAENEDRRYKRAVEQERLQIDRTKAAQSKAARQPSAAERQQSFNTDLMSALSYYSSPKTYKPFTREDVAKTLAANYGIPYDQVLKQVRSVMNDSWDQGMQRQSGFIKKK